MIKRQTLQIVQIIDEFGKFKCTESQFEEFISSHSKSNENKNFFFVSIMGGQSGGKSTLLNGLFDVYFPILPTGERKATTKGIMASFSKNHTEKLILFDLEGSDSTNKTESESETFSRRIALLALAVSEVLIINIWTHDVGKRSAMNLSILRSIFEINLQLAISSSNIKTLLLFTLRDYDKKLHGSMEKLEGLIKNEIKDIWNDIEKPLKYKNLKVEDFFSFLYVGIPHKEYQNSNFNKSLSNLRKRFINDSKNTLIDKKLHFKKTKDVPLSSLFEYLKSLWTSIQSFEELNIASQKESLVRKLCEKYSDECYSIFKNEIIDLHKNPKNFGKSSDALIEKILNIFDSKAFPSGSLEISKNIKTVSSIFEVRFGKRKKLKEKIVFDLNKIQLQISNELAETVLKEYKNEFELKLDKSENKFGDFGEIRKSCWDRALSVYKDVIENHLKIKSIDKQNLLNLPQFQNRLFQMEKHFIEKGIRILIKRISKEIPKDCEEIEKIYFNEDLNNIKWKKIFEQRIIIHKKYEIVTLDFLKKTDNIKKSLKEINKIIKQNILLQLKNYSERVYSLMQKNFDDNFRKDKKGNLRNWALCDNIRELWKNSKEKSILILNDLCEIKEYSDDFENENNIPLISDEDKKLITEKKKSILLNNFTEYIFNALRDAETQHALGKNGLPIWVYIVIFLLGFDELVWALKHPIISVFIFSILAYLWITRGSDAINSKNGKIMSIFSSFGAKFNNYKPIKMVLNFLDLKEVPNKKDENIGGS